MAWNCVKCNKKIFKPRRNAVTFVMSWKFNKTQSDLTCEVKNLKDVSDESCISHVVCEGDSEKNFSERVRLFFGIPKKSSHPLID